MKTIKYNNGIVLNTENPDGNVLNPKELINLHEPIEELIFHEIMLNNNIKKYIDLGVNAGYYILLAKKLSPKTEIIGFEGQKIFKETIEQNIKLNGFNVNDFKINYYFLNTDSYAQKSDNEVIRLSDFLVGHNTIDFLLADVQGAETSILRDLIEHNQLNKIKIILIGTHDYSHGRQGTFVDSHVKSLKMLKDNGYIIKYECEPRKVWLQPDGIIWAEKK